jgi:serine/threonine protein kinase
MLMLLPLLLNHDHPALYFAGIFDDARSWLVGALIAFLTSKYFIPWLKQLFIHEPGPPLPPPPPPPPEPGPSFPDSLSSPQERADWLQSQGHQQALDDLAFLLPNDCINGLTLKRRVGGGRTTVVWEAWSEDDERVAVKFLRADMVNDRSVVAQFVSSAKLLYRFRSESVAGVLSKTQAWPTDRAPLTYFYALDFCEGESFKVFNLTHPGRRTEVVRALAKLACELDKAHEQGAVFRDLTPNDLMVDDTRLASDPGGAVQLMDFDSVAKEAPQAHQLAITLGYSAPEAFEDPDHVDRSADIFSLARIIAYVYHGGPLPNAYTANLAETVNLLNCPARIKQLLLRSTSQHRSERPQSMRAFSEELEAALATGSQPLVFATIMHERRKIYLLVAQACIGTTVAIVLTRLLLSLWPGVHLSNTPWIATFHGIIGSLMWGSFHTTAFIFYLVLIRNRKGSRPAAAALFGAAGGLIAGMIVAIPSVLVTHADVLLCLGWITPHAIGQSYLEVVAGKRMLSAISETRMAWSYPITGLLTGCGVALCLDRGISIAIEASSSGSGVLPVPTKDDAMPVAALRESLRKVLGAWESHLYLAFPLIFAFLAMVVLHPNILDSEQRNTLLRLTGVRLPPCDVAPEPLIRSIGEGANHYLGAIGLVMGFFYRIPLIKPKWR